MISGAHSIIYSKDPRSRSHFSSRRSRPPAEVTVHPSEKNNVHELYLLCDDIEAFVAMMTEHNIACDPVQDRWGLLTRVTLPGGGHIGVYEPRHEHPENAQ